jgi:hypothetical protein
MGSLERQVKVKQISFIFETYPLHHGTMRSIIATMAMLSR